jgi:hypothetical protein
MKYVCGLPTYEMGPKTDGPEIRLPLYPETGHRRSGRPCRFRANFGSEHIHSITSSAWASNVAGTVRPSALAATVPLSAGHWKRRHEQYEDAAALAPLE